jgi:hypothetical protein
MAARGWLLGANITIQAYSNGSVLPGGLFRQYRLGAVEAFLILGCAPRNLRGDRRNSTSPCFPKVGHLHVKIHVKAYDCSAVRERGKLYTAKLIHDKRVHVFGRRIGTAPG